MFGCNDPFMLSIEAFDDADVLNTEQILYKSCRNICIRTGNVQSHIQQIKLINKDKHVIFHFCHPALNLPKKGRPFWRTKDGYFLKEEQIEYFLRS